MCGRYSLITDIRELANRFDFRVEGLTYQARFNIAPAQQVLTVTKDGSHNQAKLMQWGLIPSWTKDPYFGNRMINARAETISEKPMFREAFLKSRCLVIADGFYEWKKVGKGRIPMRIVLKSGEPFGFAGLQETWKSPDGEEIQSCTIITTTPNDIMESIHNRMPVILSREAEGFWLDSARRELGALQGLLVPYESAAMDVYAVSTLINSPKNDTPDVIARNARI